MKKALTTYTILQYNFELVFYAAVVQKKAGSTNLYTSNNAVVYVTYLIHYTLKCEPGLAQEIKDLMM